MITARTRFARVPCSPFSVNRDQTFHTNPTPGASVNVPGKLARWYRGIFVFGSSLSTVHSSTAYPPRSSSRAYSRQRAATPPAPFMSITEGTSSMTTPDASAGFASANAPARSDAIASGVVGSDVADPTRRRDAGDEGTSNDPKKGVEGTATSRRLGAMAAPERLRRIDGAADGVRFDGTIRCRARTVAGSARVRLVSGRPRAPSKVPRVIREVHTASSPPLPLRGHAPKAPALSSEVIGRESLSSSSIRDSREVCPHYPNASFRFRRWPNCFITALFACRNTPHCHAREAFAAHAHRRHDDHPVLRGPPGYGGPAGVLRACPNRTRAPRRVSFSVHARGRGAVLPPADRRPFVPRVARPARADTSSSRALHRDRRPSACTRSA